MRLLSHILVLVGLAANCLLAMDMDEFVDDGGIEALALVPAGGCGKEGCRATAKSWAASPAPAAGSAGVLVCYLCQESDPVPDKTWRGYTMHNACVNACRCHYRILSGEAKADIANQLANNPDNFRDVVTHLVQPQGSRKRAMVSAHRNLISNSFHERAQHDDELLLSKARFISFQKQWENYNSDSASESFERRLGESDSDHENASGQPRVRVQDNTRISNKSGWMDSCRRPNESEGGKSERRRHARPRSERSDAHRERHGGSRRVRSRSPPREGAAAALQSNSTPSRSPRQHATPDSRTQNRTCSSWLWSRSTHG